jgi:predicted RND superfamily exporter protein
MFSGNVSKVSVVILSGLWILLLFFVFYQQYTFDNNYAKLLQERKQEQFDFKKKIQEIRKKKLKTENSRKW